MILSKITRYIFPIAVIFAFFSPLRCNAQQPDISKKPQTITVVSDDNYPPYIFRDTNGNLQGILIDEWTLWEKKTGIKVKFIGMDWAKAQRFIAEGRADVIDTMFLTEERARLYDFSKPYVTIEVPVFFHNNISGITDVASLQGFTIGVKEGDASIGMLKKHGITTLREYASYEEIVKAAADQKIKVFCIDGPPAFYYLYKMDLEKEYRHSMPLYSGQFHRAVRKGDKQLLNIIEDGFRRISPKEHSGLEKKWRGSSLLINPDSVRYILNSSFAVFIAALALMLWNHMLRRKVSQKTSQLRETLGALKGNEAMLRATIESLPFDFFAIDREGCYFMLNDAALHHWGDVIGKKPEEVILDYPEGKRWLENNQRAFAGETVRGEVEYLFDGERHYIHEIVTPIRDDNQQIQGILGINFDMTGQKRTEEALRESIQKYSALIETTDTGFVILDSKGLVLDANPEYVRLTGHERLEEIAGRPVTDWTADYEKEKNAAEVKKCFEQGFVRNLEIDYVDKQGKNTPIEINATVVNTKNGPQILTLCRNISEHRKLEEQLRQAQKMEAIGQLAGGVAHDFNNILSAIMGYASISRLKIKDDEELKGYIEHILASAERGANLTHSLLAFSRKQVVELKPSNINDIIYGVQKILARVISEDIEFKVNLSIEDLVVEADKGQIEQVLMNLATNARDAMPNGGSLLISTNSIEIGGGYMKSHIVDKAGRYAVISVSDTGVGMERAIREHMFEPFFTTKEVGKGTGLGLAMAYGIIKRHNGSINVYSEPGKGTTLKIYLPLVQSKIEDEQKTEVVPIPVGQETILLVEDDEVVRNVTKATLEAFGYRVIEALDGEDAVRVFAENKDAVPLIISDVIMPKKSGNEVYEAARKIKPEVKVIFISGYASDVINKGGVLAKGVTFIAKPFKSDNLLRKVREVLDS